MEKLRDVSVIGALGQMGRGISLLVLLEQAWLSLKDKKTYSLQLIDPNLHEARKVRDFFRQELTRSAEKRIVELRESYKENTRLVSNEEMIEDFVEKSMDGIQISSEWGAAKHSSLIFEAALESVELKTEIFQFLCEHCPKNSWFLTNTSSIPIRILDEKAKLEGRIIGFHFYNPPTIQRLIEIIPLENGLTELKTGALHLAKIFNKIPVLSRDIAGFIGNGWLFREIRLAFELLHTLKEKEGEEKALLAIDRVTREWLVRPMGIFQLMDFIGLDVALRIAHIMTAYGPRPQSFHFPLLQAWNDHQLRGGRHPDGSPRSGLFEYEGSIPARVFSLEKKSYIPIPDLHFLGKRLNDLSWKSLNRSQDKASEVKKYFQQLFNQESVGASLSKYWLQESFGFMRNLVDSGVAENIEDVSKVLKLGFYQAYTPNEVEDVVKTLS